MKITVRVEWDMGHRLPNHGGACRNLHGHRYVADVTLQGAVLERHGDPCEGMVADFGDVKAAIRSVVARLDHKFLVDTRDEYAPVLQPLPGVALVPFVPTAENISSWFLHLCSAELLREKVSAEIVLVRLYETPTSWADAEAQ